MATDWDDDDEDDTAMGFFHWNSSTFSNSPGVGSGESSSKSSSASSASSSLGLGHHLQERLSSSIFAAGNFSGVNCLESGGKCFNASVEMGDNVSMSNQSDVLLKVMLNGSSDSSSSSSPSQFPPPLHHFPEQDELYEVPVSIIVLLSLLYGGISAAALIGNVLVLWVVAVSRRMRTVTNMFIANLALADIIIGLFAIPFQFQAALLQRWNLPDFMCAFCPFVQVLSVNVSVFTLSAIAVDRYRAVLYPLSARVSKRKATWAILSIWSVGLIIALPTELDYKVMYMMDNRDKMKPFCTNLGLSVIFRTYYTLSLVVIQYFFPLIIISGAYAHMATKLWGTTAPGNKEESRDAVVLRNKKKVIKMLALVVLLFALCWMPLQMYNFLQTLIPSINEYQYINIIWFCFHWLAMSNSCCNPFIYAIYNDKFQREFRTRLWCLRMCSRRDDPDGLNYSDGSCDFDRSKIRASYRFKNNLSVRYNHQSVYTNSGSTRGGRCVSERTTEFRRGGSGDSRSMRNSPSPPSPLFQNNQSSKKGNHQGRFHRHHRHHHHGQNGHILTGPAGGGGGVGGGCGGGGGRGAQDYDYIVSSSSSGTNNNRILSFTGHEVMPNLNGVIVGSPPRYLRSELVGFGGGGGGSNGNGNSQEISHSSFSTSSPATTHAHITVIASTGRSGFGVGGVGGGGNGAMKTVTVLGAETTAINGHV